MERGTWQTQRNRLRAAEYGKSIISRRPVPGSWQTVWTEITRVFWWITGSSPGRACWNVPGATRKSLSALLRSGRRRHFWMSCAGNGNETEAGVTRLPSAARRPEEKQRDVSGFRCGGFRFHRMRLPSPAPICGFFQNCWEIGQAGDKKGICVTAYTSGVSGLYLTLHLEATWERNTGCIRTAGECSWKA